jgi:nicotinate-nucleotide--dimethylbenzimidazole phosphoribosyltransferase
MISDQSIQQLIDSKTKPLGALGDLESLAFQICQIQNTLSPQLSKPKVLVFAADHGIADSGVSAYPKAVTAQMVLNFINGGAAINVFCAQHNIELKVVDIGVDFDFDSSIAIEHKKIARGTANSTTHQAIQDSELKECQRHAVDLVDEAHAQGCNIIGFGEMGIGNTSAAALMQHYLLDIPLEDCIGRGTGLDDEGLRHKLTILRQVCQYHGALSGVDDIMRAVGGFEIATMSHAMIEASNKNMIVLVDGFIASVAALTACREKPECRKNMIFCHTSHEHGHRELLKALNAKPLLDLNMRLGEGSGCALAYPLVLSAVNFVTQMASFESAAVSHKS